MTVARILHSKGTSEVIWIAPTETVARAAALLAERRIGSVVVSPDGAQVAGILSERDIVREIGRRGAGCLTDRIEQMMTRAIRTCTPEDKARDVLSWMTEGRFRHMPVLTGGRLTGLISIGDVVKYRLDELSMEKDALEGMIMGF